MAAPVFRYCQIREDIRQAGCVGNPGPPLATRGRFGYRLPAKPSYVDESLFGQKSGRQSLVVEFEPPWVDFKTKVRWWSPDASRNGNNSAKPTVGTSTSRKKSKYRLKSHKPSYCDESLFGTKPGVQEWTKADIWMTKEGIAKIRPLLLTPPSAPKDRPVLSSRPMRAVHREAWGTEKSTTKHGQEIPVRKPPENNSNLDNQNRVRSQSLTRIHGSSDRFRPSVIRPWTCQPQEGRVLMTSTVSLSRLCSKGASELEVQKSKSACRPPWK